MTQAAIHGVGVALLPRFLTEAEFADGRLLPAFGNSVAGRGAYYLSWPKQREGYPPLVALRGWLAEHVAEKDRGA